MRALYPLNPYLLSRGIENKAEKIQSSQQHSKRTGYLVCDYSEIKEQKRKFQTKENTSEFDKQITD